MQRYRSVLKDKPQALAMIHDQRLHVCTFAARGRRKRIREDLLGVLVLQQSSARDLLVEAVQLVFAYRAMLEIG